MVADLISYRFLDIHALVKSTTFPLCPHQSLKLNLLLSFLNSTSACRAKVKEGEAHFEISAASGEGLYWPSLRNEAGEPNH